MKLFFSSPPPYIHLWGNGYKLLLPGWPNSSLSGQPWLSQGKLRKSGSFQFRWLLSAVHSRRQTQGLSWSYVRQTVPGSLVHTLQTLALKKRVFCMYRAKLSENTSYLVSRVCRLLHPLPHVHACAHTDTHTHTSLYTCRESPTQVSSVRVQSTDYTRGAQQETRWEVCVSVCVCVGGSAVREQRRVLLPNTRTPSALYDNVRVQERQSWNQDTHTQPYTP